MIVNIYTNTPIPSSFAFQDSFLYLWSYPTHVSFAVNRSNITMILSLLSPFLG